MVRWQLIRTFSRYWWVLAVILILLVIREFFVDAPINQSSFKPKGSFYLQHQCKPLNKSSATIDTLQEYPKLNFNPPPSRSFWTDKYETRSQNRSNNPGSNPLKVFILPHSHNDPGWLKTFVNYFDSDTKKILDLIVQKLVEFNEMTFVWTEISFLDLWWQQASEEQQEAFKRLVSEGRLDIMTGGWVMTDEANSHYHAMLDQLIEGHLWVKKNLDFIPKSAWSIDPFGQGSTVPHLLASSGLSGAIIQRIHYSWKEYFAWNQSGDFYWKTLWSNKQSPQYTILTHNMPFDIYSTKHSCGPHPDNCLKFEFRKVPGMWMESRAEDITDQNVEEFANILVKQYQDTASLFPHNVAFVLVGGDFTFNMDIEFQQQYVNYKKLIDYVNSHPDKYKNTKLKFGTPTEYFEEILKRMNGQFPTLVGDFFPYSDIFSSGTPAYWTGYFTTRPFHKMMSRDLEHNLRNAEILYTIAYNTERHLQLNFREARKLEKDYELIVKARRNLGLFQHHDAITGTSKAHVTKDYLGRLLTSIKDMMKIQRNLIESIVQPNDKNRVKNFLKNELDQEAIDISPKKKIIEVKNGESVEIFVYNSLAQDRVEVISLHIAAPNVIIKNSKGYEINYQVNQVLGENYFELIFAAKLSGLSINSFELTYKKDMTEKIGQVTSGTTIENDHMVLTFNETSGLLSSIFDKVSAKGTIAKIIFGAYKSTMRDSGAYLFKPANEIVNFMEGLQTEVVITKGPLVEDVTVIRENFLVHKYRILNTKTHLDDAISIVNEIDFGPSNSNTNIEMFMKIKTSLKNGKEPEFFTDQNGFHWQQRQKISNLGIEANYYPITSCTFLQDNTARLSLITNHAQGAASLNEGEIEIMLDRRTSIDDGRGMGEGVWDSIKMQHKFYLTLEYFKENFQNKETYQVPSLFVQHMTNALNYPTNIFINDKISSKSGNEIELLRYKFPCDYHIVNFRTLTDDEFEWLPSQSALLILHRFSFDCEFNNHYLIENICDSSNDLNSLQFVNGLKVATAERTSLTALTKKYQIDYFNEPLEAMEIRTYNITFG